MAEERVSDIIIPLVCEFEDEGLEKMYKELGKFGKSSGVKSTQKALSSITSLFRDSKKNWAFDSPKIVSSYNKVVKELNKAIKKTEEYNNATAKVAALKRSGVSAKSQIMVDAVNNKNKKFDEMDTSVRTSVALFQNLIVAQQKDQIAKRLSEEIALEKKLAEIRQQEAALNEERAKQNANNLKQEVADEEAAIKKRTADHKAAWEQIVADEDNAKSSERKQFDDEISQWAKNAAQEISAAQKAKQIGDAQYVSWWKTALKEQEEAEKSAANAAKQAAKEHEEAKARIKKAWESLGDVLKKPVQKFKAGVRDFASLLYVTRRIVSYIKAAYNQINNLIDASSSWVENLNLLEVVFGDVSEGAQETKKWVSVLARTFSMDKNAIAQNVAMFKQMANAMGQAADVGERMSEVLVQLGLDISSLRNVKTETAMNDLASAIAGQIKPVRKYGFDVSLQSINAMLKETGIGGSVTNLSQSDKQLARIILLLRQSTDAWGDLGKTINTFANQQRIMNDQFETTKRLLGQVFLGTFQFGDSFDKASQTAGIATKIIWRVNSVLIAFNEILEAILPSAESVNGGIATMAEDAQDEIDDMNESLENSLASFDKFNVMTSGSSSAAGNNSSLESVFNKEALKYLEDFQKRSQQITSYARELADDLLKKFFPEFEKWYDGLDENTKKTKGTFSDWVKSSEDIKLGLLDWIEPITNFTNIIEKAVDDALVDIPAILKASADLLVTLLQVIKLIVEPIITITNLLGPEGIVTSLKVILGTLILIKALKLIGGAVIGIKNIITSLQVIGASIIKNAVAPITVVNGKLATTMSLSQQLMWITAGFTVLLGGVSIFATSLDQLNGSAKVLIPTLSVVLGLLTAVVGAIVTIRSGGDIVGGLVKTAAFAAAVTGISLGVGTMIAKSANKHAEGGYQTGGLFYAGENGAEWVGRQGNTSTIVNDKQMSDIMQQSVAAGVIQGNRMSGGGRASGDGKVAVVNLDGKRLFEVVQQNGKKVGKVFAEA